MAGRFFSQNVFPFPQTTFAVEANCFWKQISEKFVGITSCGVRAQMGKHSRPDSKSATRVQKLPLRGKLLKIVTKDCFSPREFSLHCLWEKQRTAPLACFSGLVAQTIRIQGNVASFKFSLTETNRKHLVQITWVYCESVLSLVYFFFTFFVLVSPLKSCLMKKKLDIVRSEGQLVLLFHGSLSENGPVLLQGFVLVRWNY